MLANEWLGLYLQDFSLKMCEAEPAQVEFLTWYRREQWRKNEERRMALLVEMTFDGQNDEKTRMWKNWCLRYLCKRFHDMTRWEWVPAMAALDEEWLWHGDRTLQAFEYLQKIRKMAVYFVSKNHLEGRKGVDI